MSTMDCHGSKKMGATNTAALDCDHDHIQRIVLEGYGICSRGGRSPGTHNTAGASMQNIFYGEFVGIFGNRMKGSLGIPALFIRRI